jgi:hypothetical protein
VPQALVLQHSEPRASESDSLAANIHERVIDRDDENLAGFIELGVVDVARDVGAGASRA